MTGVVVLNKLRLADPLSNSPAAILFPVANASNGAGVFTITAGGSHQLLANANAVRRGWWFYNYSTADLWIGKGSVAAAAAPHLKVPAGGYYECPAHMVTPDQLRVYGSLTGQAYAFEEA